MLFQAILEGLLAGFILSLFLGPMFFSMLQLGVEHGFRAAFSLALGQWLSDLLFICVAFLSASFVEDLVNNPSSQEEFVWYSGTIGGLMLVLFGLGLVFTRAKSTDHSSDSIIHTQHNKRPFLAYFAYCSQGFLINTINPTPILFWLGLMGASISRSYTAEATYVLYLTVMSVVVGTDLLKIYLAKSIRKWLKPHHVIRIRILAGIVLAGFGASLFVKVNFL